ncbi:MAG TPA: hypothetical protein VK906_11640 [Egicoccus sp.]|nr:hypothetical protein [Egicoccus sp.]HSK23825.1 hypothetical protein [Egicoccus sp.]
MPSLHHLIIPTTDPVGTADYVSDLTGSPPPFTSGYFRTIVLDDDIVLNFAPAPETLDPQHYAFMVDDEQFDRVLARFASEGTEYWADPRRSRPGELGEVDGVPEGRRMYFIGPDGHYLELITARYDWDAAV